jgi:hypothetical protein
MARQDQGATEIEALFPVQFRTPTGIARMVGVCLRKGSTRHDGGWCTAYFRKLDELSTGEAEPASFAGCQYHGFATYLESPSELSPKCAHD